MSCPSTAPSFIPVHLDDFHLREGEATGRHGNPAITGGGLHTAMVVSVALVARVTDHVNFIRFGYGGGRRGRQRGGHGGVCTGDGGGGALGDGAPLGERAVGVQLLEAPPQEPLLPAQLLFVHGVLVLAVLQVLYEPFRFREEAQGGVPGCFGSQRHHLFQLLQAVSQVGPPILFQFVMCRPASLRFLCLWPFRYTPEIIGHWQC